MEDATKQENTAAAGTEDKTTGTEKTFTQTELNAILKDRLDREKQKYGDLKTLKEKAEKYDKWEESNKTELEKANERASTLEKELAGIKKAAELKEIRDKVAAEYKVPSTLLSAGTEEELQEQAKALIAWANPNAYPDVRDGGEISNVKANTTRDQFEQWASQIF